MIIHTTETGVRYEVNISQEEIDRRMAELIRKLYPAWLEQRASAREAEGQTGEIKSKQLRTEPQPRPRVQEGATR